MRILLINLIIVAICGCGMHGDRDPNGGDPSADNVNFACGSKSCFSGTQYCLSLPNSPSNGFECVTYSADNCKDRTCISRDVREKHTDCDDPYFTQDQAKITVSCRARNGSMKPK